MSVDLTILAVTAHPDDEASCGGTLAKYAAVGARCVVVCATRGDGRDAQIKDPQAATRETLGQVRLKELACACARLGLQAPLCLNYQDGEVDQIPVEQAAREVARLLRELRPAIVITHDPGGSYGHPDHIAVSRFVTRAVELAAEAGLERDPPPFAPAKLYYFAMPQSLREKVPALRDRRAAIRGAQLRFVGVPDEQITTEIDIKEWLGRKLESLKCHRTQFEFDPVTGEPKTFATSLPPAERLELFGYERFILARTASPNISPATARETDLLAGLL